MVERAHTDLIASERCIANSCANLMMSLIVLRHITGSQPRSVTKAMLELNADAAVVVAFANQTNGGTRRCPALDAAQVENGRGSSDANSTSAMKTAEQTHYILPTIFHYNPILVLPYSSLTVNSDWLPFRKPTILIKQHCSQTTPHLPPQHPKSALFAPLIPESGLASMRTNIRSTDPHVCHFDLIADVGQTNTTVLIEGETGTSKEVVAAPSTKQQAIAPGRSWPSTARYPETLLESELPRAREGRIHERVRNASAV